ncbi:unnamed protein product [Cyclocybe aegerita]|uniref:JmjC domain-containing protein n=1 Tax=Cyclocybe aegerita TaxID=1973307 RepID=A0A8S0VSW0_CYCAE|nr:unnamed protein product [Cyclocybe aegerita]
MSGQLVISLGNVTPHLLCLVERIIIRAFTGLAVGRYTLIQFIYKVLAELPWKEIEEVDKDVVGWFKLDGGAARRAQSTAQDQALRAGEALERQEAEAARKAAADAAAATREDQAVREANKHADREAEERAAVEAQEAKERVAREAKERADPEAKERASRNANLLEEIDANPEHVGSSMHPESDIDMFHDPPAPPPHSSKDKMDINERQEVCQQADAKSGACHGSATDVTQAQPHPSLSRLGDGGDDTTPIDLEDTDGNVNMDATTTGHDDPMVIDLTQDAVDTRWIHQSKREKKLTAPIINPALTILPPKNKHKGNSTKKSTIHKRRMSPGHDAEYPIVIDEFNSWDPIQWRDYTAVPQASLDTEGDYDLQRVAQGTLHLWDPYGHKHEWQPRLHHIEDWNVMKTLEAHLESTYVGRKPKFLSASQGSRIKILDYEESQRISEAKLQTLLRDNLAVIVKGCPTPPCEFDEKGFRSLQQPLQNVTTIQDQSVKLTDNQNERLFQGTIQQLLDESRKPNGKVLNALECPFSEPGDLQMSQPFASDMVAWYATVGLPGAGKDTPIPVNHLRWGLCSLENAYTPFHIDAEGLCTLVQVMSGAKLWIIAVPKRPVMLTIGVFFREHFSFKALNLDDWDVEAVLLHPGTRLLMRPNIVHSVITTGHSICHGGHFYATSTIQETACGLIHSFICCDLITNTTHHPSHLLLRRLMQFFYCGLVMEYPTDDLEKAHLPDILTMQGSLDFITVCSLNILGNVLHHQTYSAPNQDEDEPADEEQRKLWHQYDVNDISFDERTHMRQARGLALDAIRWYETKFEVIDSESGNGVALPKECIALHASSLLRYKVQAIIEGVKGAPHCEYWMLKRQVNNALELHPPSLEGCNKYLESEDDNDINLVLKPELVEGLLIRPKVYWSNFEGKI